MERGVLFVVQQFVLQLSCRCGGLQQIGQDLGVAPGGGVVQRRPTEGVPTQCRSFVLQQGCHTQIVAQQCLKQPQR